jgi:peptidoglycan/LPS O-acetylase OafA/YrhL
MKNYQKHILYFVGIFILSVICVLVSFYSSGVEGTKDVTTIISRAIGFMIGSGLWALIAHASIKKERRKDFTCQIYIVWGVALIITTIFIVIF